MANLGKKEGRWENDRQEKNRYVHQTTTFFVILEAKAEQVHGASLHDSVQLWSQPYLSMDT